jgi:hypothetical protein
VVSSEWEVLAEELDKVPAVVGGENNLLVGEVPGCVEIVKIADLGVEELFDA